MKTETEHLNIDVIFEVGTLTGELVMLGFFVCLFKDSQFTLTIELLFRCSFFFRTRNVFNISKHALHVEEDFVVVLNA